MPTAPAENPGTRKLTGTFTAPPPMCLGEPYMDRRVKDERSKGVQIRAGHLQLPSGSVGNPGCFSTTGYLCEGDKFAAQILYKDVYKDAPDKKKNGFLTSDFPKRDEFSNTIRTEQLREVLKAEQKRATFARDKAETLRGGSRPGHNQQVDVMQEQKTHLYDVVFRQVPTSLKLKRDDRQSGLFYTQERKRLQNLKETTGTIIEPIESKGASADPTWVNITVGGRNLTVLVDASGKVLASKESNVDLRQVVEDVL